MIPATSWPGKVHAGHAGRFSSRAEEAKSRHRQPPIIDMERAGLKNPGSLIP